MKNKIKAIEPKTFIIPLIIIIIMLIITESFMINGIKNHYYSDIKKESLSFAKNYSSSITKATEAQEIVHTLLGEKLLVASKAALSYEDEYSNDLLEDVARNLEVDVIYYYNPQGEMIYSSNGNYIGWKVYRDHPAYSFMRSEDISMVESVRKDSETDLYYKYGYFKSPNGGFIQIGVLAERIQNFVDSFEIQKIMDDMSENEAVSQISFINNEFSIIASTENQHIGSLINEPEVIKAISENSEYDVLGMLDGANLYEVYLPVYSQDIKIGTLYVAHPLDDTEAIIKQVNIIGAIGLSLIFISLIYTMVSIYKKNKQLLKLAYYDSLTDLPNREYLMDLLTETIKKGKDNKKAILLINCSNFRTINLVSGYQYGDMVLKEIGNKLNKLSGFYKMLFRFTADRFVIYVDNYKDRSDLVFLSFNIIKEFKEPLLANKYIDIQIGIVEIDNKYNRADQILKDVSIALNNTSCDNLHYVFFNEKMEKSLEREDFIEQELRKAVLNENINEIYLEYQPQVDLRTNQIVGFEALARMKTEMLGSVSPLEFINIAERKQLIVPLGNYILRRACKFIYRLNDLGFTNTTVAVNISGIQLLRDDFTKTVTDIIKETGIKVSNLELEITESILLESYELINEKLKNLRSIGVKIALDDFGTGYSSFARLNNLNIDYVKIDKHFIDKITNIEKNGLITGDIISMSHKLGLAVVAEGVELQVHKEYLIENNCDRMQGYLFSRPLPEKDAILIMKDHDKSNLTWNVLKK